MKIKILFLSLLFSFGRIIAQNVYIPDANFKNALITAHFVDTNGDGEIQVSEAENFYGGIGVVNKKISDLTGIEAFINITGLSCGQNSFTNLDLSNNKLLRNVNCTNGQINNLNVNQNIDLETLYINNNQLTNLDVSNNTKLYTLNCYSNQLQKLNLKSGNNSVLAYMYAWDNPNLTCIQVDNVNLSNTYPNWHKDTIASYSSNCGYLFVNEINQKEIKLFPNPVSNILYFSEKISDIQVFDISGKNLSSIKGNRTELNVENLQKGNYILKGKMELGKKVSLNFIKK